MSFIKHTLFNAFFIIKKIFIKIESVLDNYVSKSVKIGKRALKLLIYFFMIITAVSFLTSLFSPKESSKFIKLDLKGLIVDQPKLELLDFNSNNKNKTLLSDVLEVLKLAEKDKSIEAILLNTDQLLGISPASRQEIIDALDTFKKSGKKIVALNLSYNSNQYSLASNADLIIVHPLGGVELTPYSFNQMYFKNFLKRLNVDVNVFYQGKYKSAAEPYYRNNMSDENKEQLRVIFRPIWNKMLTQIQSSRSIKLNRLNNYVENFSYLLTDTQAMSQLAKEYNLVDHILRDSEVDNFLKQSFKLDLKKDLPMISYKKYLSNNKKKSFSKDKIAIVYIEGPIILGKSTINSVGDKTILNQFKKIKNDDSIKGVILRVNSPGGSAFASDRIAREVLTLKEEGKLIYSSFGGVAASGGYYVAALSDKIFAHSDTITGSIGVVGIVPSFDKVLNTFDLSYDGFNLGSEHLADPLKPLSSRQYQRIDTSIKNIYNQFLNIVSEGRKLPVQQVDEVAQGRVWRGKDAKDRGLVDELGSLSNSIEMMADALNLKQYSVIKVKPDITIGSLEEFLLSTTVDLLSSKNKLFYTLRQNLEQQTLLFDKGPLFYCTTCLPAIDAWLD